MIDILERVAQTIQAMPTIQVVEPWIVKAALGVITAFTAAVTAMAGWLVGNQRALNKKWDAFAVTWYGDPSDKSGKPNGAKNKLYSIGENVTKLNDWTREYDRALGALAKDNETLRGEWQPGDPERRTHPRVPRL